MAEGVLRDITSLFKVGGKLLEQMGETCDRLGQVAPALAPMFKDLQRQPQTIIATNSLRCDDEGFVRACLMLGVDPLDDLGKIEKVYKVRAKRLHSDVNGGDVIKTEQFKALAEAIGIIREYRKKKREEKQS